MRKLLLIAVLHAVCTYGQKIDPAALDALIESTRTSFSAPGVAVAIVKGDDVVYIKGFGLRRIGAAERVTPETRMAIGSTTKAFTTAAMAILVDEKKMDWDDPVRKHLPWFRLSDPLASENVTMRDIVCHRTGLSRHDLFWYGTSWSRDEIIRRIGLVPLTQPFRSTYQYQNIMFLTAGEIVGKLSGGTWEDFVSKRIFEPLGMRNSDFSTRDVVKASDFATPHVRETSGEVKPIAWKNIDNIGPAGSINSSVRDMANWVRLHLAAGTFQGKRVISEKNLQEMHSPQMVIKEDGPSRELNPETAMSVYGLGWRLQDYRGRHMVSHGGAIDGFRAQVALLPREKIGMVILTNLGQNNMPEALRFGILDEILELPKRDWNKLYKDTANKQTEEARKRREEALAKRHKGTKPSRELDAYAGNYEHPAYGTVQVSKEGETLAFAWGIGKAKLAHAQFDTFESPQGTGVLDGNTLQFQLNPAGDVSVLEWQGMRFRKAPPAPPASASGGRN